MRCAQDKLVHILTCIPVSEFTHAAALERARNAASICVRIHITDTAPQLSITALRAMLQQLGGLCLVVVLQPHCPYAEV